jgi:hypothetical protein
MSPRHHRHPLPTLPRGCRAVAAAAVLLAALVVSGGSSAADDGCTVTWDGGALTTRWNDAANWSGDQVPAAGAIACIPAGESVEVSGDTNPVAAIRGGGSVTVRAGDLTVAGPDASAIGGMTVAGGRLIADGELASASLSQTGGVVGGGGSVSAPDMTWLGGIHGGSGTTRVSAGGGGLALAGAGHSAIGTRTLQVDPGAQVTWTAGDLELRDSARLVNYGAIDIRGDLDFTGCCARGSAILNEAGGVVRKSAGIGETNVTYPIVNDGSLEIESGIVTLWGTQPGRPSRGSFAVGDGATLRFVAGESELGAGSQVSSAGDGAVLFAGGFVRVGGGYDANTIFDSSAASVAFDSSAHAPRLELGLGVLGGSGEVSTPDLAWAGGTMGGSGRTRIEPGGPGLEVGGTARHQLFARTLSVAGGARATLAEGVVDMSGGARIENEGLLELHDGTRIDPCCDADALVHNLPGARLMRSGDGRSAIGARFRNDGIVQATAGTLALGDVANLQDGTLTDGTWIVSAELELPTPVLHNAATVVLSGPASRISDGAAAGGDGLRKLVANDDAGDLTLERGRDLTAPAAGDLENRGVVRILDDSALTAGDGEYVQTAGVTMLGDPRARLAGGSGTVDIRRDLLFGVGTVDSDLRNEGEVRPGLSPGVLTVAGDYTQSTDGTLAIEVGGTGEGEHDRLDVAGAAHLAGTLRVETLPDFAPAPEDEFEIVRHDSVSGEFERAEGLEVDADHRYHGPDYDTTATWLREPVLPLVGIRDVTVDEGAGEAVVTLELSFAARRAGEVDWHTMDGTATAPDDYAAGGGTVRFERGEQTKTVSIPVQPDGADEPEEYFRFALSRAEGVRGSEEPAIVTIRDDDPPPPDPQPDPDPEPVPDPDPEPVPDPDPQPTPDPEPTPEPDPQPNPDPEPTPDPDPQPEPDPQPAPDPGPDPAPDPQPAPDPGPDPAPDPQPAPDPSPQPEPDPEPQPAPAPQPEPDPAPQPDPAPIAPAGPAPVQEGPPAPDGPSPRPIVPTRPHGAPSHCVDDKAPRASFRPNRHPIRASRSGLAFRGVAWERGCGKLDRVTIAIARREGGGTGLCRYLQPDGRLGRVVSCRRPTYVRARGTAHWRFRLARRLPIGTYTARIRAVDRAGNAEKKVLKANPGSRNFVTFFVR